MVHHHADDQADDRDIDHRQQHHYRADDQHPEPVEDRRADRLDPAAERGEDLWGSSVLRVGPAALDDPAGDHAHARQCLAHAGRPSPCAARWPARRRRRRRHHWRRPYASRPASRGRGCGEDRLACGQRPSRPACSSGTRIVVRHEGHSTWIGMRGPRSDGSASDRVETRRLDHRPGPGRAAAAGCLEATARAAGINRPVMLHFRHADLRRRRAGEDKDHDGIVECQCRQPAGRKGDRHV